MQSKIKSVIIAVVTVILCMVIIAMGTLSLIRDGTKSFNHLEAGVLDVSLTRTHLISRAIGADGTLQDSLPSTERVRFDIPTKEKIFGPQQEAFIVPGTYFEATMEIANNGNVAFDYSVHIISDINSNHLAEQLFITVNGDVENGRYLKDIIDNNWDILSGSFASDDKSTDTFTVRLEFIDTDSATNNLAQTKKVSFDLVVTATQTVDPSDN